MSSPVMQQGRTLNTSQDQVQKAWREAEVEGGRPKPQHIPALSLPFHMQIHVVSTWQTYIYNAFCLKIKLFLISATCLSLGFHLAGLSFRQGCLKTVVTEV